MQAGLFRDDQRAEFARHYNRTSFMFEHALHRNPVFALDGIAALAGRLPPDAVYCSLGAAEVGGGWAQGQDRSVSVPDLIRRIGEIDALVMLKSVDRDPEFGPVFRSVVAELAEQAGPALTGDIRRGRATLMVSAPQRVTAYHIDAEANYLLQIAGEKQFYVFPAADRSLLSEAELEAFYAGDHSAARYRQERQDDAAAWHMVPGTGVHVPVNAPHWVRNGDSVSVSLSVNYDLVSNERIGRLYRLNARLRRAGLRPHSPGESPWRDQLKLAAFAGVRYARRVGEALQR